MNSYHNQCRRGMGRNDCSMPEMAKEKEGCWPIGMTYVPMQEWREIYPPEEGFHKGTIFKELDLPFLGRRMC